MFNDPNAPRLPLSVFDENAGVYDELCDVFREISEHFHGQEGSLSLVRIAEIDFNTGEIGKAEVVIAKTVPDAPLPDAGLAENFDSVHNQTTPTLADKKGRTKRKKAGDGKADVLSKRTRTDATMHVKVATPTGKQRAQDSTCTKRYAKLVAEPTRRSARLLSRKLG